MGSVEIINARLEHLEDINDIRNYYVSNTEYNMALQPRDFAKARQWYDEHVGVLPTIVALIDGEVVGWASLSKFRTLEGYRKTAEVSVYAKFGFEGRGIGSALVAEIERLAPQFNVHAIVSVITACNASSIKLHEKCGFDIAGILKEAGFKNGTYFDIIFMEKILRR